MRTWSLLWFLLALPAWIAACSPVRGRGGGGGGDDDDDGSPGPVSLSDSYTHRLDLQMFPTELGQSFGFSQCASWMTGTVSRDTEVAGCEECAGVWTGVASGQGGTCSASSEGWTYGFGVGAGGLAVWTWSEDAGWEHAGDAEATDGVWVLQSVELMGGDGLELGEVELRYEFQ